MLQTKFQLGAVLPDAMIFSSKAIFQTALLAVVYFMLGSAGYALDPLHGFCSPLWPASGFAISIILIYGWRLWPGLWLGAFALFQTAHGSLIFSTIAATSDVLGVGVLYLALRRVAFDRELSSTRDIFWLTTASFIACGLVDAPLASLAAITLKLVPLSDAPALWFTWWMSKWLAKITVGTFVLVWMSGQRRPLGLNTWPRRLEFFMLAAIVVALTGILFSGFSMTGYLYLLRPYMLLPLILWATLRFGRSASMGAVQIVSVIGTVGTLRGFGRFGNSDGVEGLLALQMFLAIITFTFLLFDALIEDRKRSEKALRASESRFRRLVEADIIGVYFWDMSGRITQPNNAFLRMLGFDREGFEELGLDWRQLTPPEFQSATQNAVRELRSKGTASAYEKEYFRKDGTKVAAIVGSALLGTEPESGVSFVLDIGEHKKTLLDLKKAIQVREDIVAIVSHDLKNPIGSLLLNLEFIDRALAKAEITRAGEIREKCDRMRNSARRMQQLTENILDITTLEAGKMHLRSQIEDATDLVGEALDLLQPLAEEKSIRLLAVGEKPGIFVECDRERILQVLSNLVGNALKFTPPHGSIHVSVKSQNQEVTFTVSDTGPGISPQHTGLLFDRFWQATPDSKSGIGLGLAICKGIIDAHQGRIWVEHEQSPGAVFHFTLRRAQWPAPTPGLNLLRSR